MNNTLSIHYVTGIEVSESPIQLDGGAVIMVTDIKVQTKNGQTFTINCFGEYEEGDADES